MVTKILALLLYKVGQEHVAQVCGKNGLNNTVPKKSSYTIRHEKIWELQPQFTGQGRPVNLDMAQRAAQNACSFQAAKAKKILKGAKPQTCTFE